MNSKEASAGTLPKKSGQLSSALIRLMKNPMGALPVFFLGSVIILAILAPFLGLPDPGSTNLRNAVLPPSGDHWLGTDTSGRDVLSRLLWGSRTNLIGALIAVAVSFAVGVSAGLMAGYFGGKLDAGLSWFNNLNMALPGIVILLAVSAVVGNSVNLAMAVFGVILSPAFFRVVRGAVMAVRNELYVDAARVSGLSDMRIITRHILTVVRAPVIIQSMRVASIAIGVQAALEFLGISDSRQPSWGQMLNEGFRRIAIDPLLVLWPCLVIGVVSASLILLGNAIRDALEDRDQPKVKDTSTPAAIPAETYGEPQESSSQPEPSDLSAQVMQSPGGGTPSAKDALLYIEDLSVGYGSSPDLKVVVDRITLSVSAGEVLGLVGESGSGKTQTAFSILGLLPAGGRIVCGDIGYDGQSLVGLNNQDYAALRGSEIAYIPQEPMSNLDPSFKIGYQLTVPMKKKLKLSKQAARKKALALLERVGIPDPEKTFNSYPHEISGGMAQRVLIAGAVSCNPKLLVADEPTTALDVTVQAEVLDLLRELQHELGMAMIMVTHNFGVVADICERVAVMQHGKIVEIGDVERIFENPQHPYTQGLLAAILEDAEPRPYPFDDADYAIQGAQVAGDKEGGQE